MTDLTRIVWRSARAVLGRAWAVAGTLSPVVPWMGVSPQGYFCTLVALVTLASVVSCTPAPDSVVHDVPAAPASVASVQALTPARSREREKKQTAAPAAVSAPPRAALAYRAELTRTAREVWGLNAPVPVFAAQIHQESGWRPDAVSPVGALGLSQFMPGTVRWIASIDPALAGAQPYNPAWAMRAMVVYDQRLYVAAPARYTPRERMWVALRGYNGGAGHWNSEARATGLAAPTRQQVDTACGKATRSIKHCAENLAYPRRILVDVQPRYAAWGPVL